MSELEDRWTGNFLDFCISALLLGLVASPACAQPAAGMPAHQEEALEPAQYHIRLLQTSPPKHGSRRAVEPR